MTGRGGWADRPAPTAAEVAAERFPTLEEMQAERFDPEGVTGEHVRAIMNPRDRRTHGPRNDYR